MNPLLELTAILLGILLIALLLIDAVKPKFYKLNEKIKKAQKTAQRKGKANTERLAKDIKGAFINQRIDGMEKEFLFQRVKIIENLVMAKSKPSVPKYAAGDEMDRL